MREKKIIIKAVTRSLLDFCMLPGTATGAEILWLYSLQWKNRFSLITIALISFAFSHMHINFGERFTIAKAVNGPENTM